MEVCLAGSRLTHVAVAALLARYGVEAARFLDSIDHLLVRLALHILQQHHVLLLFYQAVPWRSLWLPNALPDARGRRCPSSHDPPQLRCLVIGLRMRCSNTKMSLRAHESYNSDYSVNKSLSIKI